jgi:hypothetical protein
MLFDGTRHRTYASGIAGRQALPEHRQERSELIRELSEELCRGHRLLPEKSNVSTVLSDESNPIRSAIGLRSTPDDIAAFDV